MSADERQVQRYVVFGGPFHDQKGGWDDFLDSFTDLVAANTFAEEWERSDDSNNWWQIIDLTTGKEVARGRNTF